MSPAQRVALAVVVALAVLAPTAGADITASTITSSDVTTFDYWNRNLADTDPANVRTVSGTATGTAGDPVVVKCISATGAFTLGSTTLAADNGTFTVTGHIVALGDPCVLRALPSGATPGDLAPFAPSAAIYPGSFATYDNGAGKLYNWEVSAEPRPHGYADYYSLGDCGLCDMKWRDDAGVLSEYLFFYNAATGDTYKYDSGSGVVDLPLTTVDGLRAFAPFNVTAHGWTKPGFVGLTFSRSVDQATGDATTQSTEALMTCATGPSDTGLGDCAANDVVDTGLRVDRAMLYDHQGQVFRIADVIRNTSESPHEVSLGYINSQQGGPTGVQLPGEPDFSARQNTTAAIPAAALSTIFLKNRTADPIDPLTNPVGAITASPAADQAIFISDPSEFVLRWG